MSEFKKKVYTKELFNCENPYLKAFFDAFEYPWEMLPHIKILAQKLAYEIPNGFRKLSPGVIVGENVKISPLATIEPPAVIGNNCEIRTGAYIRGSVIIGNGCVIGNSSELKNCILLDNVQVPHYNYVGDSILGNHSHMGAGSMCSNLKADKSNVVVRGEHEYETGLRKFGAILGDYVDIGCNCVLNPGTVIGKKTTVYPLVSVRGVIPENCIVKSLENIVIREEGL